MAPLLSANEEEIPFDINEDEILAKPLDDAKPSKLKKAAAAFAAFLLFFLIVSYSVAFLGMDSIPGLIKSRQMDVYGIPLGDSMLVFSEGIYDEIVSYANENEGVETKFCLMGERKDGIITVTSLFKPLIIAQDFKSVTSKPCPEGTIVSVHTHPLLHCTPSIQDYRALHSSQDSEYNAVMCERGRFYFY
ncbi:MAG: hypothetical protein PHO02_01905 [Candidatus Nanoarchaeia archaeon]|nr:hypothetical protein [Candidatus Nanoarchaeia archaeon]